MFKKTLIFFFAFLVFSGKLGKQSLRFRAAITFFFVITIILYRNQNPVIQMVHWTQFRVSLNEDLSHVSRGLELVVWSAVRVPRSRFRPRLWKDDDILVPVWYEDQLHLITHTSERERARERERASEREHGADIIRLPSF